MLNYSKGNEFDLHKNTQWLCTRTRFETEAYSHSEMGYYATAICFDRLASVDQKVDNSIHRIKHDPV